VPGPVLWPTPYTYIQRKLRHAEGRTEKQPHLSYHMTDFKENGYDHGVYIPLDEDITLRRGPVNMVRNL
jgi:hypothetical protein